MRLDQKLTTVIHLPKWIEKSEFITQYKEDHQDEDTYVVPRGILCEFPDKLTKYNIRNTLEIMRYCGIHDTNLFYKIFCFLFDGSEIVKFRKKYKDAMKNVIHTITYIYNDPMAHIVKEKPKELTVEDLREEFPEFKLLWKNIFPEMNEKLNSLTYDFNLRQYIIDNDLHYLARLYKEVNN